MPNLKVVVASHKPYWMPDDSCYLPVHVGAAGKETMPGFQRDDEGDNIGAKNPNYCELTGLYWAWKNLDAEYQGIAHYRRHFAAGYGDKKARVATGAQMTDIVLPKPRHYYIEINYTQYVHTHHEEDLAITREIIARREPKMVWKYDEIMNRTYSNRFYMFVMRRDLADTWHERLFDVLFNLENYLSYKKNNQVISLLLHALTSCRLVTGLIFTTWPTQRYPLLLFVGRDTKGR